MAAIAVAGQMKQTVDDIDNRIRLLLAQIQKAEWLLVKAKKIADAAIRAENYDALNKAMRRMSGLLRAEPAIIVPDQAGLAKPPVPSAPGLKESATRDRRIRTNAPPISSRFAIPQRPSLPSGRPPSQSRQLSSQVRNATPGADVGGY